jgi:hypothetical protein
LLARPTTSPPARTAAGKVAVSPFSSGREVTQGQRTLKC